MSIETYFRCDVRMGAADAALLAVSGTAELSPLSAFATPQIQALPYRSADADL
jgi:hypothetical protein